MTAYLRRRLGSVGKERNLARDGEFTSAMCDADLPAGRNFESGADGTRR